MNTIENHLLQLLKPPSRRYGPLIYLPNDGNASPQTLLFMDERTLKWRKLEAYVILKILKYCTSSSAKSYQCKYAVKDTFKNKSIKSMEELGAAIKQIIQYKTIRGKFSSVHPDLTAEGITRVEVGEEGLHFIKIQESGLFHYWT